MNKLIRLMGPPQSPDLIWLNDHVKLNTEMVELIPLLQIILTEDALKTSLNRMSFRAIIKNVAYLVFFFSSVLCILFFLQAS